ncbi:single-stranded DNA-binding protein [Tenacibaculum sp. 190524A02b]|uniref:single-stranded DNA-binding protein n=1 Tax=Tenacibaculum vairaonense TaxID=3137860 RepID=UPI0031FB51BC
MLNQHHIIGNLGNDPETHTFSNGNQQTKFQVATTSYWIDKNSGEKIKNTVWHNIIASGKYAQTTATYLKKGSKVYLEGEVRHRSYGETNNKKYITEVHLTKIKFLSSVERVERPTPLDNMPPKTNNQQQQTQTTSEEDDDLPF